MAQFMPYLSCLTKAEEMNYGAEIPNTFIYDELHYSNPLSAIDTN